MIKNIKIDPQNTINKISEFIKQNLKQAGFSKLLLGLSGGIDSALSCFLVANAIGKENVLGIRMPYKTSSEASLVDAQKVIDQLGIESKTIEITPFVEPLLELIPLGEGVRRGNVMARMRMIVLYDQSVEYSGLVVGTGNKTEILLGYSTQYGDAACAFNPLGDLYKAQVVQLAKYLEIPENIISKAPSADLWEGQTDEAELGFTYQEADEILFNLFEKGFSRKQLLEKGFKDELINKVISRIRKNEFKRSLPPVFRLEDKAVSELEVLRSWK